VNEIKKEFKIKETSPPEIEKAKAKVEYFAFDETKAVGCANIRAVKPKEDWNEKDHAYLQRANWLCDRLDLFSKLKSYKNDPTLLAQYKFGKNALNEPPAGLSTEGEGTS